MGFAKSNLWARSKGLFVFLHRVSFSINVFEYFLSQRLIPDSAKSFVMVGFLLVLFLLVMVLI